MGWTDIPRGTFTTPATITFSAASAVDMGSSWTSDEIDISDNQLFAIDADWEGADTPVGTVQLQGRNDSAFTWKDITDSNVSVNGASGALWNLADQGYRYIRIIYTSTSGGSGDDFTAAIFYKG